MKRNRLTFKCIGPYCGCLLLISLLALSPKVQAQINDDYHWTWMKGTNGIGANVGVYGQRGLSHPDNTPGSRGNVFTWQDDSGNFYLFGGTGESAAGAGSLNDIWKYSVHTNEWTFLKGDTIANVSGRYGVRGVGHPDNNPGGRYGPQSWQDSLGNFWIFGGFGRDAEGKSGALGDLWKYDPVKNEWIWMSGDTVINLNSRYGTKGVFNSTNHPGARYTSFYWTDEDGCFWLYGGTGRAMNAQNQSREGSLGDLWKYNPYTNQWAWMHGDTLIDQDGNRGNLGVANANYSPGSRAGGASWYDNGKLYLYGGIYPTNVRWADMWSFDIATQSWAWINGSNAPGVAASHGVRNVSAAANTPGSRVRTPATWKDDFGNFYLFGGQSSQNTQHSDLWRYNISANEWTWIRGGTAGSNTGLLGSYGAKGVPDINNLPGRRELGPACWTYKDQLWMLGGRSKASGQADFNDLWRLSYNCAVVGGGTKEEIFIDTVICGDQFVYGDQIFNESGNYSIEFFEQCDTTIYHIDLVFDKIEAIIRIDVYTLSTIESFSTYQWLLNGKIIQGADQSTYTVSENGAYQVIVTNENGCIDTSDIYEVTNITNIQSIDEKGKSITISPNPAREIIYVRSPFSVDINIRSLEGRHIKSCLNAGEINLGELANGIYLIQISDKNGQLLKVEKLVKQ